MIATRLILWHQYANGRAFDLSENRNHGRLADVGLGAGAFSSSLHFTGGDCAVWVEPSPSLTNLREVRTQVHFNWDPVTAGHRHNLIEGELSFSMFVNPDGSLQATILNQLGNWEGTQSAAGVVPTGEWHTAEFVHDGISHCTLYLDGHVVAEGYSSPGPVRSVGGTGIAIGHWPEIPATYTLEGYVDWVKVWCDDPVKDGGQLIDDCCIDRPKIAANNRALSDAGLDSTALGDIVRGMLDVGRQASYWLTQDSKADRDSAMALANQLLAGYANDDVNSMTAAVVAAGERLVQAAPAGDLQAMWAQLETAMQPLWDAMGSGSPVAALATGRNGIDDLKRWLDPWCLDKKLPRPDHKDRPKPKPATDHGTDPDTDARPGESPDGWVDPGTHEQVPPPPPPDTPPGLPPNGPDGAAVGLSRRPRTASETVPWKKTVKKAAPKETAKKAPAQKAAPQKAAAKKTVHKKTAAKKAVAEKATKNAGAKKAPAKKRQGRRG